MWQYAAPLRDMRFVIERVLQGEAAMLARDPRVIDTYLGARKT